MSAGSDGHAAAHCIRVDADSAGQRIDNFLLRLVKGVPRTHLYRILRRGEVRVNSGRVRAAHRLCEGDLVRIPPLRQGTPEHPPEAPAARLEALAARILFEDQRLLVIDKPAGLAVHGGSGLDFGLIELLRQARPGRDLELVHRLDRETSGCLAIGKRRGALRELHRLIRAGGLDKRYLALLTGELARPSVTVEAPLRKNVLASGERLVRVDPVQGKPARTVFRRQRRWRVAGRIFTLAEAIPVTGRTHQIRVHAAHLGSPLAGDPRYGDPLADRILKPHGLNRLFLHAASLGFRLDDMARPVTVEAPLPEELARLIDSLEQIQ